jgi:hypothetical protein
MSARKNSDRLTPAQVDRRNFRTAREVEGNHVVILCVTLQAVSAPETCLLE